MTPRATRRWSTSAAYHVGRPSPISTSSKTAHGCAPKPGTSSRFGTADRVGQKLLQVGRDFDFVVLGIGIGGVPHVCAEILQRDERWREMCEHVKTVATQAAQAWLSEDLSSLGWSLPPVTLSGFVEPFDTWADMSHLLPLELWPVEGRAPKSLAYFCSVLPDTPDIPARPEPGQSVGYVAEQRALIRRSFRAFPSAKKCSTCGRAPTATTVFAGSFWSRRIQRSTVRSSAPSACSSNTSPPT